jgi:hypothetical protein
MGSKREEGFYDELDPAGDAYLQCIAYIQLIDAGVDEAHSRKARPRIADSVWPLLAN